MAKNDIDTLQIKIQSDAAKAVDSLDALSKKLGDINKSLSSGNIKKFDSLSKAITGIANSAKILKNSDLSSVNLRPFTEQLNALTNVNTSQLKRLGKPLTVVADSLGRFKNVSSVNVSGLDSLASGLNKLGNVNFFQLAEAPKTLNGISKALKQFNNIGDVSVPSLTTLAKDLKSLSEVKFETLRKASKPLSEVGFALRAFSKTRDVNVPNLGELAKSLGKLSEVKFETLKKGAKPLKNIAAALKSFSEIADVNVTGITELAAGLGKLRDVGISKLDSAPKTLKKLGESLRVFSGIGSVKIESLATLANNLNKLATVNFTKLKKTAAPLKNVGVALRSLSGIGNVNITGISSLSQGLIKLSSINYDKLKKGAKPLKQFGTALRSLSGLSGISIPNINAKNIEKVGTALLKLQSLNARNIPKVADAIKKIADAFLKLSQVDYGRITINKVVNSLSKLLSIDMSKFNASGFKKIANAIGYLAKIPDVSPSINRFVSALARLVNAGSKIVAVSNYLPSLGRSLKKAVQDIKSAGDVSDSTNRFINALAKLASAGDKTGKTASQLNALTTEVLKFFRAMQNAPRISENTIRMTEALARLASAGRGVNTAANQVTSALDRIAKIGSRTASTIKNMASTIISAFSGIGNSSAQLSIAQRGLSGLLSTAAMFAGPLALVNFSKSAIQIGSDIAEVENVVDTSFGAMAGAAYDFADTAIEQFGLSELAAKRYAGTMMSTLNASGVAQKQAAEMAVSLAGLAGDIASFYNIDSDLAFYKLMSGMNGETEPLKQLGINMNIVNLEAYAMSQGITKSYRSMSLAEQQLLRYNYIMAVTTKQQGDFAKTANTYANQVRILKQQWQQFSSIIGQGFIQAVQPAVKALNMLMSTLIKAAEAFRVFMYTLTGKEFTTVPRGVVNEFAGLGDMADSMDLGSVGEDAASGLDDATKSAKKLEKVMSVLSFDELNQLSAKADTDAGGGNGGGGGGSGAGGGGAGWGDQDFVPFTEGLRKSLDEVNEWARQMREAFLAEDWERLGTVIAEGLNAGLQKVYDVINWENVGPRIEKFMDAFTRTFNSFVDAFDWDLLGRTIGAGINTLVNTFNLLIGPGGIDFVNIGSKLSEGLRGAISEIEWENLGTLLGNYFMIPWNMLSGFVTQMAQQDGAGLTGWQELGTSLGNALNGIVNAIDLGTIGASLGSAITGVFQAAINFAATFDWKALGTNIYQGINNFFANTDWAVIGQGVSDFAKGILTTINTAIDGVDWEQIGRSIVTLLSNIDWGGLAAGLFDAGLSLIRGLLEAFNELPGPVKLAAGAVAAFFAAFKGYQVLQKISSLLSPITTFFSKSWPFIETALRFLITTPGAIPIVAGVVALGVALADLWNTSEDFRKTVSQTWEKIKKSISDAIDKISGPLNDFKDKFSGLGGSLYNLYENTFKPFVELFAELATILGGQVIATAIDLIADAVAGFVKIINGGLDIISGLADILTGIFTLDGDKIVEGFKKIGNGIIEALSGAIGMILDIGGDIVGGLFQGIQDAISGVADWIKKYIVDPFVEGFKKLFGINSPSTVMAEQGGYLMDGLLQGLGDAVGGVLEWIADLPGKILEKLGDATQWLVQKGKDALEGLKNGWESFKDSNLGKKVSEIGGFIKEKVGKAGEWLKEKGKNALEGLQSGWEKFKKGTLVTDTLSTIGGFIKEKVGDASQWIKEKGKNALEGLQNGWNGFKENLGSTVSKIGDFIKTNVGNAGEWLKEKGKSAIQGIKDGWEAVKESNLGKKVQEIGGFVKTKVGDASQWLVSKGKDAISGFISGEKSKDGSLSSTSESLAKTSKSGFSGLSSTFKTYGSDSIKGLKNGFILQQTSLALQVAAISTIVTSGLSGISSSMYSAGQSTIQEFIRGFKSISIPLPHLSTTYERVYYGDGAWTSIPKYSINWYKTGGLFNTPSMIGVGEAGAEAVLPLENPRTMRAISDSILSNAPDNGVDEETLTNAIARGFAMAMMGNQQPINVTVQAELRTENDEVLARAVTRGQQSLDSRYNPTPKFAY